MFCMNCGTQLPDGAKFCMNCGTKVGEVGAGAVPSGKKYPSKTIAATIICPIL